MSKKTPAVAPKTTHEATVRRLGPGVYRAEDLELGAAIGCGWVGPVREGHWWEARKEADADADAHSGREPKPAAKGPTPSRPMRIPDPLWGAVLGVAKDEGLSASEISRQALAADPRVAAKLEVLA